MHPPPVVIGGGLVDGRPDERVPHRDRLVGLQEQSGVHGAPHGVVVKAEPGGGVADHVETPGVVGGDQQDELLHGFWKAARTVASNSSGVTTRERLRATRLRAAPAHR